MGQPEQRDLFRVEKHGNALVIIPSRDLSTASESQMRLAVKKLLGPFLASPPRAAVVDLSEIDLMLSVVLSFMLLCHLEFRRLGIGTVLAEVTEHAREVLALTGLIDLWEVHETRARALEALRSR